MRNHQKTDRMLGLALRHRLPVVLFAEGGVLGAFGPEEIGPSAVQHGNGVIVDC